MSSNNFIIDLTNDQISGSAKNSLNSLDINSSATISQNISFPTTNNNQQSSLPANTFSSIPTNNNSNFYTTNSQQYPSQLENGISEFLRKEYEAYSAPRILNTEQYLNQLQQQMTTNTPQNSSFASYRPLTTTLPNGNGSTSAPTSSGSYQSFNIGGEKKRSLPPSVTLPHPFTSSNAFLNNLQNRQTFANQYNQQYQAPPTSVYRPPTQTPFMSKIPMTFSLINADEFTARVETGSIPSELVRFLSSIQGCKFDWKAKRFIFPVVLHDQLQTTLQQKYNCSIEPIPRAVLAAAQLKSRAAKRSNANNANGNGVGEDMEAKDRQINEKLSKFLPEYVLQSLATFQKEAVKFIMEKKGRALVGDEMGLGKTRTGIAASFVYYRDWPVLIVCPSSARHHWHAELLTILVTNKNKKTEETQKNSPNSSSSSNGSKEGENQRNNGLNEEKKDNEKDNGVKKSEENGANPITIDMTGVDNNGEANEVPEIYFPDVKEEEILLIEKTNHFQLKPLEEHKNIKYYIISYSLITKLLQTLQLIPFNMMILDESHYIKSRQAKRTQSLVPMIQNSKRAILLSGTPALSRPLELFTQLNALLPKEWNDFKAFGKRYCQDATNKQITRGFKQPSLFHNSHYRFKGYGDNAYKGANHTQELHVILTSTIMIRRLKKDILLQLPKKKRYLIKIDILDAVKREVLEGMLGQLKKYEELISKKNDFKVKKRLNNTGNNSKKRKKGGKEEIEEGGEGVRRSQTAPADLYNGNNNGEGSNNNNLAGLTNEQEDELTILKEAKKNILLKLFTQSGEAKLPAIIQKLDTLFFQNSHFTGKILLFAHHRNVLDQLSRHLQKYQIPFIRIDGYTSSKERHVLTQAFQQDVNLRVAILGVTAAGVALTLTAANIVCFVELYWTPGSLIQAEDRVHRIGQLKNVKIFYFFGINSIDELLWPLVRKKMQLLGEFVEGTNDQDLAAAVLTSNNTSSNNDNNSNGLISTIPKEIVTPAVINTCPTALSRLPEVKSTSSLTSNGAQKGKENNFEVVDPITKKIYNLDTDEDILQLVDELNEEEIQIDDKAPPSSSNSSSSQNPPVISIDVSTDEEEEFRELAAMKVNKAKSNKKKKKKRKLNQSNEKGDNSSSKANEDAGDSDEDDDEEDDEEESEEGEQEDEYEEYLKRADPPDILASVYMQLMENDQAKAISNPPTIPKSQFSLLPRANTASFPFQPTIGGQYVPTQTFTMQKPSFSYPIQSFGSSNRARTPEIIDLIGDMEDERLASSSSDRLRMNVKEERGKGESSGDGVSVNVGGEVERSQGGGVGYADGSGNGSSDNLSSVAKWKQVVMEAANANVFEEIDQEILSQHQENENHSD